MFLLPRTAACLLSSVLLTLPAVCPAQAPRPSTRALPSSTPAPASASAPTGRVYTKDDYARAEKWMPYNVKALVLHAVEDPKWLPDGRMWYRDTGAKGTTFMLVDPVKKTKAPAFDQTKLAAALTALMSSAGKAGQAGVTQDVTPLDGNHLPLESLELTKGDQTVIVGGSGMRVRCDLSGTGVCTPDEAVKAAAQVKGGRPRRGEPTELSPDGKHSAFIRDWNLWMRDVATGVETQLTFDGTTNYGYATDNAGWTHSDSPILVWSPDSRRIATFQQDQRKTGEMYLYNVTTGHPQLTTLKYPLPGDKDVTMIERVVIDVPNTEKGNDKGKAKVVRLKMPPDQHRSTLCDDVSCKGGQGWDDVQWSADSKTLAFVSTSRDHKQEWMRVADPSKGNVRDVMGETVAKFYESGNDKVNWHYLSATNEVLWFSERDNWGHLYLYDGASGKLKTQITKGDWNVTQVLGVDEKARVIYFAGVGREMGEDPYYRMYYRVDFDGKNLQLLTPERADHVITPSPDNRFFVDTYSTPVQPEVTVVRDASGAVVVEVAHEDITRLKAAGWQPPVQFQVKARDGETDLYGFLFRPSDFSTDKHYAIINHVYPGPQTGSCGARTFSPAHGDMQSLAELGFIVICLDGMGTPWRSKTFHEAYFGDLGDNTIPDQVIGMKQLAERYPWIDLNKAGMYGHSGGGNATAAAMFHYPDFFKVGISESGNHDNRAYEDDWAEKWSGLDVTNPDGTSNYDSQANQSTAKNLQGKLLLAHGTMDDNVPPNNTLLVVDALIKANKDFDLLMIPNAHHGYGEASQYMTRRRWDYFVTNLVGGTAPKEYEMKPWSEALRMMFGPQDIR